MKELAIYVSQISCCKIKVKVSEIVVSHYECIVNKLR